MRKGFLTVPRARGSSPADQIESSQQRNHVPTQTVSSTLGASMHRHAPNFAVPFFRNNTKKTTPELSKLLFDLDGAIAEIGEYKELLVGASSGSLGGYIDGLIEKLNGIKNDARRNVATNEFKVDPKLAGGIRSYIELGRSFQWILREFLKTEKLLNMQSIGNSNKKNSNSMLLEIYTQFNQVAKIFQSAIDQPNIGTSKTLNDAIESAYKNFCSYRANILFRVGSFPQEVIFRVANAQGFYRFPVLSLLLKCLDLGKKQHLHSNPLSTDGLMGLCGYYGRHEQEVIAKNFEQILHGIKNTFNDRSLHDQIHAASGLFDLIVFIKTYDLRETNVAASVVKHMCELLEAILGKPGLSSCLSNFVFGTIKSLGDQNTTHKPTLASKKKQQARESNSGKINNQSIPYDFIDPSLLEDNEKRLGFYLNKTYLLFLHAIDFLIDHKVRQTTVSITSLDKLNYYISYIQKFCQLLPGAQKDFLEKKVNLLPHGISAESVQRHGSNVNVKHEKYLGDSLALIEMAILMFVGVDVNHGCAWNNLDFKAHVYQKCPDLFNFIPCVVRVVSDLNNSIRTSFFDQVFYGFEKKNLPDELKPYFSASIMSYKVAGLLEKGENVDFSKVHHNFCENKHAKQALFLFPIMLKSKVQYGFDEDLNQLLASRFFERLSQDILYEKNSALQLSDLKKLEYDDAIMLQIKFIGSDWLRFGEECFYVKIKFSNQLYSNRHSKVEIQINLFPLNDDYGFYAEYYFSSDCQKFTGSLFQAGFSSVDFFAFLVGVCESIEHQELVSELLENCLQSEPGFNDYSSQDNDQLGNIKKLTITKPGLRLKSTSTAQNPAEKSVELLQGQFKILQDDRKQQAVDDMRVRVVQLMLLINHEGSKIGSMSHGDAVVFIETAFKFYSFVLDQCFGGYYKNKHYKISTGCSLLVFLNTIGKYLTGVGDNKSRDFKSILNVVAKCFPKLFRYQRYQDNFYLKFRGFFYDFVSRHCNQLSSESVEAVALALRCFAGDKIVGDVLDCFLLNKGDSSVKNKSFQFSPKAASNFLLAANLVGGQYQNIVHYQLGLVNYLVNTDKCKSFFVKKHAPEVVYALKNLPDHARCALDWLLELMKSGKLVAKDIGPKNLGLMLSGLKNIDLAMPQLEKIVGFLTEAVNFHVDNFQTKDLTALFDFFDEKDGLEPFCQSLLFSCIQIFERVLSKNSVFFSIACKDLEAIMISISQIYPDRLSEEVGQRLDFLRTSLLDLFNNAEFFVTFRFIQVVLNFLQTATWEEQGEWILLMNNKISNRTSFSDIPANKFDALFEIVLFLNFYGKNLSKEGWHLVLDLIFKLESIFGFSGSIGNFSKLKNKEIDCKELAFDLLNKEIKIDASGNKFAQVYASNVSKHRVRFILPNLFAYMEEQGVAEIVIDQSREVNDNCFINPSLRLKKLFQWACRVGNRAIADNSGQSVIVFSIDQNQLGFSRLTYTTTVA